MQDLLLEHVVVHGDYGEAAQEVAVVHVELHVHTVCHPPSLTRHKVSQADL